MNGLTPRAITFNYFLLPKLNYYPSFTALLNMTFSYISVQMQLNNLEIIDNHMRCITGSQVSYVVCLNNIMVTVTGKTNV